MLQEPLFLDANGAMFSNAAMFDYNPAAEFVAGGNYRSHLSLDNLEAEFEFARARPCCKRQMAKNVSDEIAHADTLRNTMMLLMFERIDTLGDTENAQTGTAGLGWKFNTDIAYLGMGYEVFMEMSGMQPHSCDIGAIADMCTYFLPMQVDALGIVDNLEI